MNNILSLVLPRTIIGLGSSVSVGSVAKDLGATKVFIITDAGVVKGGLLEKIKSSLEGAGFKIGIFDGCQPNAPSNIIHECSEKVREGNYDMLVGVGGGSVMDTTKAVSIVVATGKKIQDFIGGDKGVKKVLPKILIPTTAGTGSEWTIVAIITDESDGKKKPVGRAPYVRADAVIVDPELTLGLPQRGTAETGIDALSHAIEAYVSCKSTGIICDMFAETAIRLVSDNLRLAYAKGSKNIEARNKMSIAATLAAGALQVSHAGLAHCMDGLIVERAHISHGEALGILLPHVMEFNRVAAPEKFAKIAELMGEKIDNLSVMEASRKSVDAMIGLCKDVGIAQRLRDVGISEGEIPKIADDFEVLWTALANEINPRDVRRDDVEKILRAAL